jgi:hypothetical protein
MTGFRILYHTETSMVEGQMGLSVLYPIGP